MESCCICRMFTCSFSLLLVVGCLQPTTTTDVATNFTCIDSQVATQIPPSPLPPSTTQPTHKGPTSLHEFTPAAASNPNATLHGLDMLTDPPKQTDALPLHRLSTKEIQITRSQGLCFQCPETFHPGHQFHPPKFVVLESEHEPPWSHLPWTMATSALRTRPFFRMGVLIRVGV